jgi:prevent-host-death family protein
MVISITMGEPRMVTEVNAVQFRQNLGEMLNQVRYRRGSIVIKKDGKPVAALIDAELFARIRRMQDSFDEVSARIAKVFADVPEEEVTADIDALVAEERARWRLDCGCAGYQPPSLGVASPGGVPGSILEARRIGGLKVVLSQHILDELVRVLPRLRKVSMTPIEIRNLIECFVLHAEFAEPDSKSTRTCATPPINWCSRLCACRRQTT